LIARVESSLPQPPIPLSFLGSSLYATPVTVATQTVSASSALTVAMASAGGQAVVLRPLS
jgi:hypothetical protein